MPRVRADRIRLPTRHFTGAVARHPTTNNGHLELGNAQEAEAVCREGLTRFPDDTELLFQQGTLLRKSRNFAGARASLASLIDVMDPPGLPVLDTEQLFRLPGACCCFTPLEDAPPVTPLPALSRGYLTLGSLHKLAKLHAGVFDLWCQVLHALPTAHLLMFRDTLVGETKDFIHRQFTQRGISSERLDLRQGSAMAGYLGVYQEIDVSLDTFPYSGGTTTCEALWMGPPTFGLSGMRPAARGTAMVLASVGLRDWAVPTPEEYVALAVRWAKNLEELAQVRAGLRERMRATLCDSTQFTRRLEESYRIMWRRWCAGSRVEIPRKNNLVNDIMLSLHKTDAPSEE